MKYVITGRGTNVTDGLRSAIEEKLGKLEHYFAPETEVHVTLKVEKDRQKVEVTVPVKGHIIRAEQVSDDMYVSIDLIEDIIERQLRKYKTKIVDSKQNVGSFTSEFMQEDDYEDEDVKVIRTKRFAVKPMDPEEACVQMELLNHSFYVFRNAETDEVNVVYKRKGGDYGLIEPEF
jgi:ribosomal subunit interface protein